jgi:hypothetical protein
MELMEERDEQMRSKYYDPVEDFPNKIDRLLDALNQVRCNRKNSIFIFYFN